MKLIKEEVDLQQLNKVKRNLIFWLDRLDSDVITHEASTEINLDNLETEEGCNKIIDAIKLDMEMMNNTDKLWYEDLVHAGQHLIKDILKLHSHRWNEGFQEIQRDFDFARKKWDELDLGISFDDALEKWNAKSELADKNWYAKPLYNKLSWDDMVRMFSKEYNSLDEDFEEERFDFVDRKSVKDYDGFWTDYTMYYDNEYNRWVFVFGDSDLYRPEHEDFDFETDNESEAWEWFEDYKGPGEEDFDDDLYESLNDREKRVYIDVVNKAEDIDDLKDIVHEIYNYDKKLFAQINKFPKDKSFEEIKDNILRHLRFNVVDLHEDASTVDTFSLRWAKNDYMKYLQNIDKKAGIAPNNSWINDQVNKLDSEEGAREVVNSLKSDIEADPYDFSGGRSEAKKVIEAIKQAYKNLDDEHTYWVEESVELKEDSLDQCRNDANSIARYIDKNGPSIWCTLVDYDMYPMKTSKVSFEVEGDWRHDHLAFKDLVYDWAEENNRNIFKIDSKEIGNSESDDYTARYDIFITADNDSLNTLNSMRKLFAESLDKEYYDKLAAIMTSIKEDFDNLVITWKVSGTSFLLTADRKENVEQNKFSRWHDFSTKMKLEELMKKLDSNNFEWMLRSDLKFAFR